jgi:hypothetical protein
MLSNDLIACMAVGDVLLCRLFMVICEDLRDVRPDEWLPGLSPPRSEWRRCGRRIFRF